VSAHSGQSRDRSVRTISWRPRPAATRRDPPLTFLPDKLPGWLEVVHSILPIQAMGEVTRGTIAPHEFPLQVGSFLTLGVWCVLGFMVTYAAMTRRG
jgi:hypothetical protein